MYWLIRLRQISCQRRLLDAFVSILVKAKIKLKFKVTKGTTVIRVMIAWGIIMILNQVIFCFDHVLYCQSMLHHIILAVLCQINQWFGFRRHIFLQL